MSKASSVRLTLTTKLLILFLPIVLIASLTIGFISYRISARSMTQAVFSELEGLAVDTAHQIEAVNERNFSVLHSLSELAFVKDETLSLAEKNMQLQGIAAASNGRYQNIAFYDKEGNSITADGRTMNFASREYFKQSFAGKNFVSDPTFSTVTDSILQHYGVPVYGSEGYPIGSLVMVISGNAIQTTISEIDVGEGMHPSVINYKTKTTVANANEGTDENESEEEVDETQELGVVLNNIFSGKEDTEDFVDPNLKVHLIASYKKIADTDWTVFAVAPYDFYFKGLTQMKIAIAISTVVTILVAAIIASVLVTILTRPLKTVKHSITKIASGNADLTQRIPDATNDEIGDVVKGFNGFVKKLHGIVSNLQESKKALGTVGDDLGASAQDTAAAITEIIANIDSVHRQIVNQSAGVDETAGAVNQTAANINSLEDMIEDQSQKVQQASAAVEQMIGNISSVTSSVDKMSESFDSLRKDTQTGLTQQQDVNGRIQQIEQQSAMLQDANAAISSIAEQTNLLAMNAAIEAAHAGEAGKGFSVVADEIRKLSETSSAQSKTIGDQLNKIKDSIKDVVTASSHSSKAFESLSRKIQDTDELVMQIKSAMEEQNIGSQQISEALHSMNDSTIEVRSASVEMSAGNKAILDEVQKLKDTADVMKNSMDEMSTGARKINETGAALNGIADQVKDSIGKIGSQIDLFKV